MSMQEVNLGGQAVIKYDFKGLLKKHIVEDVAAFTFDDLRELVSVAYGTALGGKEYSFQYIDEDGDAITISSTFDVVDAFRIALEESSKESSTHYP